jgi:antitoxin (DNA-binding transcriptional repressor) of toxin-antitoxin stability system
MLVLLGKSYYLTIMETTITATELARNLSDILNRVRYKGERFLVQRGGETIAALEPPEPRKVLTVGELVEVLGDWRMPEGLADAIEDARAALGPMPEPPWPS